MSLKVWLMQCHVRISASGNVATLLGPSAALKLSGVGMCCFATLSWSAVGMLSGYDPVGCGVGFCGSCLARMPAFRHYRCCGPSPGAAFTGGGRGGEMKNGGGWLGNGLMATCRWTACCSHFSALTQGSHSTCGGGSLISCPFSLIKYA